MTAPAEDIGEADPGLARERTDLAWTRTAISFAALGGALLRSSVPIAGFPVLIFSVVIWELGRLPHAARTGRGRERRLRAISATITAIALAALALGFLGR